MPKVVYIGLTGLPGSGKGEFVNTTREFAHSHQIGFHYYSLSDVLRAEALDRGLKVEREVLNLIGNELRERFGNGALSQIIMSKIEQDIRPSGERRAIVVIDAVRTPEEVRVLREQIGRPFQMTAIQAPQSALASRIASRNRYDESREAVASQRGARELLEKELGRGQPGSGLNILGAMNSADHTLTNSSSLSQFQSDVIELLRTLFADKV